MWLVPGLEDCHTCFEVVARLAEGVESMADRAVVGEMRSGEELVAFPRLSVMADLLADIAEEVAGLLGRELLRLVDRKERALALAAGS